MQNPVNVCKALITDCVDNEDLEVAEEDAER